MQETKNDADIRLSKYMSYLLRHHPEKGNLTLDEHGWADVSQLLIALNRKQNTDMKRLEKIVRCDEKQRYAFNGNHTKIRANQGHSIPVDVELKQAVPPRVLFHGTGEKSVPAIEKEGLKPMSRLYVHLSVSYETARKTGQRHGKPAVFLIDAEKMYEDGIPFYLSANGIWLVKHVPPKYLRRKQPGGI